MSNFGAPELIIILIVVLLVFGVGRLSRIGGEMGSAIREFRRGIQGDEPAKKSDEKSPEGEQDDKA